MRNDLEAIPGQQTNRRRVNLLGVDSHSRDVGQVTCD